MMARYDRSRFAVLAVTAAFWTAGLSPSAAQNAPVPVDVETISVNFAPLTPWRKSFDRLEWRGGFEIVSPNKQFGGLSGLVIDPDGKRIAAVGDRGTFLTAEVGYRDGLLSSISKVRLSRLTGPNGRIIRGKGRQDAEAIALEGRTFEDGLLVGFERRARVLRYRFRDGRLSRKPATLRIPRAVDNGPNNKELESIARLPKRSPFGRALMVISEAHRDRSGNILGWIVGGRKPGRFAIRPVRDFAITDIAVVPGTNDIITLERRFTPTTGAGMLLRLIEAEKIAPGAVVDGERLLEANQLYSIDNMEGLALHRVDGGELRLTIISDDNFNRLQRTLLLQFALRTDSD